MKLVEIFLRIWGSWVRILSGAPFTYRTENSPELVRGGHSGGYGFPWSRNHGLFPVHEDFRDQPVDIALLLGVLGFQEPLFEILRDACRLLLGERLTEFG